ncbi:MAG TPA: hypothetical protein VHU80_06175 [Polyangiaceae bacterium]|nr:hypothetical protein [Polyangiaceae bacterium]
MQLAGFYQREGLGKPTADPSRSDASPRRGFAEAERPGRVREHRGEPELEVQAAFVALGEVRQ